MFPFNFKKITHILKVENECQVKGLFSLAGSVPAQCFDFVPATSSDALGGRAVMHNGHSVAPRARYYKSWKEAAEAVKKAGGTVCSAAGCACRAHENKA